MEKRGRRLTIVIPGGPQTRVHISIDTSHPHCNGERDMRKTWKTRREMPQPPRALAVSTGASWTAAGSTTPTSESSPPALPPPASADIGAPIIPSGASHERLIPETTEPPSVAGWASGGARSRW